MEKKPIQCTAKIIVRKDEFEKKAWLNDQYVCGIDEVGRGCLAGPVVTAAVILPLNKTSRLLKDSKILTHEQRIVSAQWIYKNCFYAFGIVDNRTIDRHNIWQATLIAMKKALINLLAHAPRPQAILVDAMPLKLGDTCLKDIAVHHFPKGETKSSSIAAASIVAKIKRDALMDNFNTLFPGFSLNEHKGYATQKHTSSFKNQPPLIIHRESFLNNIETLKNNNDGHNQQSFLIIK